MIDSLPLDLFGNDDPDNAVAPTAQRTTTCPWCAATVTLDASTCPACEARLSASDPPAPEPHNGICQWCGSAITPDTEACPACGWDARGDNEVEMPGITTPLSESQVRTLYGGSDPEPDANDTAAIVAEIVGALRLRG